MIIKIFFLLLSVCMNINNWVHSCTLESYFRTVNVHVRHKTTQKSQLCKNTTNPLQKAAICKNIFSILRKSPEYRDLYVDYSAIKNDLNALTCFKGHVSLNDILYLQIFLPCPARSAIQLDAGSDGVNYKFGDNKIAIYATRKPVNGSMNKTKTKQVESLMFVFLKLEENLARRVCNKYPTCPTDPKKVYELTHGYDNFLWENITALNPEELDVTVPKLNENVISELLQYSLNELKQMENNENNILRKLNVQQFTNLCNLILGRWKFEYEFLPDEENFPNIWRKVEKDVTLMIPHPYGRRLIYSKGYSCFSKINSSENSPVYELVEGLKEHEVILAKKLSGNYNKYFEAIELIENVNIEYIHYTMPGSQLQDFVVMNREVFFQF